MDISKWDIERIMQLPDHAFGRRFIVSCSVHATGVSVKWDISEVGLPNHFVLWQLLIYPVICNSGPSKVRIAMGDNVPTSSAMMNVLEPMVYGVGFQAAEPRHIEVNQVSASIDLRLRMPIRAGGRRMVIEGTSLATKDTWLQVMAIVSSVPKEVPDWILSDLGWQL